ncbi:MAG: DegT/DnrJ/EryC1/StrS family aminotransferase [Rhodospirillaceae bacterium]
MVGRQAIGLFDGNAAYVGVDREIARFAQDSDRVTGKAAAAFEKRFTQWCSADQGLMVSSGVQAAEVALAIAGVRSGSKVVVPALCSEAMARALLRSGADLTVIDVDPETLTMDPAAVKAAFADKELRKFGGPQAIIVSHLFGHPAHVERIREAVDNRLVTVIEDCDGAQGALMSGRRIGGLGDLAAFSFSQTSALPVPGSAGLVLASNNDKAEALSHLSMVLQHQAGQVEASGLSKKSADRVWKDMRETGVWPDPVEDLIASVAIGRLEAVDGSNLRRQRLAGTYEKICRQLGIIGPAERTWAMHAFQAYVCRLPEDQKDQRDILMDGLLDQGIGTTALPCAAPLDHPALKDQIASGTDGCPNAKMAANEMFTIPMYPSLQSDHINRIFEALKRGIAGSP